MAPHLFHFSEDPTIQVFVPRERYVWADDEWHQFRYWFPRECPRATWWAKDQQSRPTVAIQWDWLDTFLTTTLYAYTFDGTTFTNSPEGGGWITEETITPRDVSPVGELFAKHREAGNEFRIVADLWALWLDVIERPGIDFSGIRLKNLPRHPQFG